MTALVVAIFLASVLGSFHCVGMCGAFLAVATGDPGAGWRQHVGLQSAYHVGRLLSYICVGAAAGAAGGMIDVAGSLAGIRPLAAALAGAAMILFGIRALLRSGSLGIGRFTPPDFWTHLVHRGHRFAMDHAPVQRALAIGLLTTLLPCGWLYGFAVTAAGTGSPLKGILAMATFWAGTLPALIFVGAGLRRVLGPVGRRLPVLTCIALVGAGLYTLLGRTLIDPVAIAARITSTQTGTPLTRSAATLPHSGDLPCCNIHDSHH